MLSLLAKIEKRLEVRSYVEVERVWPRLPREEIARQAHRKGIEECADTHRLRASITDPGIGVTFRKLTNPTPEDISRT